MVRITSYFSFVFCYPFIFIADFIIMARVQWGYQLLVLGIETFVLQLLVIALTVLEFRKSAQALLNPHNDQFAMIKPSRQLKVMAVGDEDDYQEGIPEVDEDTLIRSKLKTEQLEIGLRQQALARILH